MKGYEICSIHDTGVMVYLKYEELKKDHFQKSKRCRDGQKKLLANQVHIQGMTVDEVYKQEPRHKWLYISHNHPYISSSE